MIIIDLQNDFLPGGALAVPQGDLIIPVVNRLLDFPFDLKLATKDWHPKGHISFASTHHMNPGEKIIWENSTQILWPEHCVQGSFGASFPKDLNVEKIDTVFYKGQDSDKDSYSTFFDNARLKSTNLDAYLKEKQVQELFIAGLATDYCVKYSVLDALSLGFKVHLILDACKAVNLKEEDEKKAIDEMQKHGAILTSSISNVFQKLGI